MLASPAFLRVDTAIPKGSGGGAGPGAGPWLHSVSHIKPSLRSLLLVGFVTAARDGTKMSPLSPLGIPQGFLPGLEGLGWLKHAVPDVWTWPPSSGLGVMCLPSWGVL